MNVNPDATGMRPLLTIAIPTYNRSDLLLQLLDCLRKEIRGRREIHLLISDNASTDETQRVVQEETGRGSTLDYIRNEENVGAEENFIQCYERATGKYIWIISDDDLLRAGTLDTVLSHLKRDEYDLVFIEPSGFSGTPPARSPRPMSRGPVVCTEAREFLKRAHIFTTLVSCNIINKDRVEQVGHKPFATLLKSGLPQLGWTYTALRGHRKSLYIGEKLVCYRLSNTGGYGVCHVFGTDLARVTNEWLATPSLNKIILNASLERFLPAFVLASKRRTPGAFAQEDPHVFLSRIFRDNPRYWIFIYPLVVLPGRLAQIWLQMIRVFNRLDRAFGYPSLGR